MQDIENNTNAGELQGKTIDLSTRNPDGTFKEGVSGNAKGKLKGTRNFSTIFNEAIAKIEQDQVIEDAEKDVIEQLIYKARKGDMRAMTLLLAYRFGAPKQKIDFEGTITPDATTTKKVEDMQDMMLKLMANAKKDVDTPDNSVQPETTQDILPTTSILPAIIETSTQTSTLDVDNLKQ